VEETVRRILGLQGKMTGDAAVIGLDEDLYRAGLTSHATVNVMLALEDEFDVEFPNHLLRKSTFESIGAILAALTEIGAAADQ
jgi:acyl carrier protein